MRKQVVCVVSLLVSATLAYGEVNKINSFIPVGEENALADGMAILQYNAGQDETSVMIILSGFTPNTHYDFELVSPAGATIAALDVLTTDEDGNAHFKTNFTGEFIYADILIYLSEDAQFTQEELRAVGSQSH